MTPPCIICYGLSSSSSFPEKNGSVGLHHNLGREEVGPERLKLFFKLLGRYVGFDDDKLANKYKYEKGFGCKVDDGEGKSNIIDDVFNAGTTLSSCRDCSKIMESFCDLYHKLKSIELLIFWKVWTLTRIMFSAQRAPSKVRDFKEGVAKKLQIETGNGSELAPNDIIKFKQNLVKKCRRRLGNPFPRLVIKQCDSLGSTGVAEIGSIIDGGVKIKTNANVFPDSKNDQQPTPNEFSESEATPIIKSSIMTTSISKFEDNLADEIYKFMGAEDEDYDIDDGDSLALECEPDHSPPLPDSEQAGGLEFVEPGQNIMDSETERADGSSAGHVVIAEDKEENLHVAGNATELIQTAEPWHTNIKRRKAKKRTRKKKTHQVSFVKVPPPIITTCNSSEKFGKPQFSIISGTDKHECIGSGCSKVFKNYITFESHWKSQHLQVRYKCTVCSETFRRRDNYGIHFRRTHLRIRFQCPIDKEMFTRRTVLRAHMQTHHSDSGDWGELANQARPIHLKPERHQKVKEVIVDVSRTVPRKMTPSSESDDDDNGVGNANENKRAMVEEVKKKLEHLEASKIPPSLQIPPPLITSNSKVVQIQKPGSNFDPAIELNKVGHYSERRNMFECVFCKRRFHKKYHLMRHLLFHTHERCHFCKSCPEEFGHGSTLKSHYLTKHSIRPPRTREFPCGHCTKTFSKKYNLTRHMQVHLLEDNVRCQICNEGFPTLWHLGVHRSVHTKRFRCDECGNSFRKPGKLKDHQLKHTGVRRHACQICPKAYFDLGTLQIHIRTHTLEKPYKCRFCTRSFSSCSDRSKHQRMGRCQVTS